MERGQGEKGGERGERVMVARQQGEKEGESGESVMGGVR
jgi:hypothetical protein